MLLNSAIKLAVTMNTSSLSNVAIIRGQVPGCIGRVAELHGAYYHAHWQFGPQFEARVTGDIAEFMGRYDEQRDGLWTASTAGRVECSIAIDAIHADTEGAHLRWFIVSDVLRGSGVGGRLLDTAIEHCRIMGYPKVYLWTFEGLDAARHLYEKAGFSLVGQHLGRQWGAEVNEQRFELLLK